MFLHRVRLPSLIYVLFSWFVIFLSPSLTRRHTAQVVDCGGGTVDITVHRVEQTSPLRLSEVREPSGGPWGSTYIDAEFERFLRRLIGEASWERLKTLPAYGEH